MRKLFKSVLAFSLAATLIVQPMPGVNATKNVAAGVADDAAFSVPAADANGRIGAKMPYTRYDSRQAVTGGGAAIVTSANIDKKNIASQASEQSYIKLPGNGAYAEWTMNSTGAGVTMRFTMPDTGDGMGQKGSVDVYVNGSYEKTVDVTSYYMWQYFGGGNPSDTNDGGAPCFAFDEVHFKLSKSLKKGDKIRIQSSGKNNLEYGVDFLEIEEIPSRIEQPDNSLSVEDYGAVPDDGKDDYSAIYACTKAADEQGMDVYLPEGTYHIGQIWRLYGSDMKITGAGMWYTNIQFTSSEKGSGGISGGWDSVRGSAKDGYCKNIEFCNMYINSNLRSRYNQEAVYKCFMDVFTNGSVIHDIWQEHFECGFWFGDYNGNMDYSDGVKVINCRIRNNLADGVNFCQGTSNAMVYNCSIRNNGDDGLACWNNNYMSAKDETGNVFAYNTLDFIWRAGAIALYGGSGHKVYNNYICDTFMAGGIHLNTTFDGYKFSNNSGISFDNNIIVRGGTRSDSWNEELGAVDVKQDVKNVTFNNTFIYDAQHDGVCLKDGPSNIVFNNTKVFGTGVDGMTGNYSSIPHSGVALRLPNGTAAKFNGLEMANIAPDVYASQGNINRNWPYFFTGQADTSNIKNVTMHDEGTTYKVPAYPDPVNDEPQGGGVTNPLEGITGYDVVLEGLSWSNQNGSTTIKEGDNVTYSVSIKNKSNVNIPEGVIIGFKVVVDGGATVRNETYKGGLKAGESVKLSSKTTWEATRGGHTVVATADDSNKLPDELSETNNTRTKSFNVEGKSTENTITRVTGGYDLVVSNITWNKEAVDVGDRVVFTAEIMNAGDTAIPAGTTIGYQIQIDGNTSSILWCDTYNNGLAAGAKVKLTCNSGSNSVNYWNAVSGAHTVTAWVDDVNRFANEVNENNNKYTISIAIPTATMIANPDLPDNLDNPGEQPTQAPTTQTPTTQAPTTQAPTTQAPTTQKPTEKPTETPTIVSADVKVEGFQMSAKFGGVDGSIGLRTIYSAEQKIENKKVTEVGVVYGLVYGANPISEADLVLGSTSEYVKSFSATENGILNEVLGSSQTATYYARTMSQDNLTAEGYKAKYYTRAYAILEDGTIAYSTVSSYNVFDVTGYIYKNRLMRSDTAHNYLYDKVLKVVNSNYQRIDYNWSNTVVKPEVIK